MTLVTAQMSVSLDGFSAGPKDPRDLKELRGWQDSPAAPGFFRLTRWVVDAMSWRERLGFQGRRGTSTHPGGSRRPART
jgi:hypothetical protein